jgi:allantoinase
MGATFDTLITGGQIVAGERLHAADLALHSGRIAALTAPGALRGQAAETVDATGLLVLPGAIDVHFHCRTPGYDQRGDFFSETCAAAAGGVTSVFEMPISNPGCATPSIFHNRRSLIERQAIIDVALYGAPGTLNPTDVQGMADAGAIAFKIFTHRAPLGRDDEFIGICLTDDDQLHEALRLTKTTGRRLVVHAESDSMLEAGIRRLQAAGRNDLLAHPESRPPVVEASAIARILTLAEDLGAPVHIAHVTSAQALAVVRRFRRAGLDVTAETCPHYLLFSESDYLQHGPYAKINPPLRSQADQHALWQGLVDGSLDVVTTDHSTFLAEEKERGWADIWRAPSGGPGVQCLVPTMLSAALNGQISLADAVRLIAATPARIFGLADRKGAIAIGLDADLCLYDPAPPTPFSFALMHSRARAVDRLYRDRVFQGRVVATYSHGRCVFREGSILAEAGSGRFLQPTLPTSYTNLD